MGFSQTLPFDFSSANQLIPGGDGALITPEKDGENNVLKIVVDTCIAGKMSITLTWDATPPSALASNLLRNKESIAGN